MTAEEERARQKRHYFKRYLAPACGFWNYNFEDNTYTLPHPTEDRKMKISAPLAEMMGAIVRREYPK